MVFGALACAARFGALLGLPALLLGVLVLGRSLALDARVAWRGEGRAGAIARAVLALFVLPIAIGLAVVGPAISLGLFAPPQHGGTGGSGR
jgi:hypothetical protein